MWRSKPHPSRLFLDGAVTNEMLKEIYTHLARVVISKVDSWPSSVANHANNLSFLPLAVVCIHALHVLVTWLSHQFVSDMPKTVRSHAGSSSMNTFRPAQMRIYQQNTF